MKPHRARDYTKRTSGKRGSAVALVSGGLDSGVLLAWCSRRFDAVYPLFVGFGMRWERAELHALKAFLGKARLPGVRPAAAVVADGAALYRGHWALKGPPVPAWGTADELCEIPGRNVLLLAQGAVYAARVGAGAVALGVLSSNPFPDATPRFFKTMESAVSLGLGRRLRLIRPLSGMKKPAVARLGRDLPLELTLSCMDPVGLRACRRCSKCCEREAVFPARKVPLSSAGR